MEKKVNKFYLLYTDSDQSKLLSTAASLEDLNEESQYYTEGVWFEYDRNEGSNHLYNEKKMKGSFFPKEAKERVRYGFDGPKKPNFKWVA